MSELKTTDFIKTEYGALICPRCGCDYLHHCRVIVYDRLGEDGIQTDVTTVSNGLSATHRVRSAEADNPSSRRDGLVIDFYCEQCGGDYPLRSERVLELRIAQHKGQTLVEWKFEQPKEQ